MYTGKQFADRKHVILQILFFISIIYKTIIHANIYQLVEQIVSGNSFSHYLVDVFYAHQRGKHIIATLSVRQVSCPAKSFITTIGI